MKSYFLDTSFLVDLMNEEAPALEMHEEIKGQEVTGTPCIYELSKFTDFELSTLFSHKEVIEFTVEDAESAGEIYRRLAERGEPIAEIDTVIAGMVKNRDLKLVTRDEDFSRVDGLDVEILR